MYRTEIRRVDSICVEKLISILGEDVVINNTFNTEKSFGEYFYSEEDFAQVSFSIKLPGKLVASNIKKNVSVAESKLFEERVNLINNKLIEIQKEVAGVEVNPLELSTYFSFSNIGIDLGYCKLMICNRNKKREEEEYQLDMKEHSERMKTDMKYREEQTWLNEEHRPYGGAFSSSDELYKHIR